MGLFQKEPKKLNRFRVGGGFPGLRGAWYRLLNRQYLDIHIHRGYRLLTRIVTPDVGMLRFSVDDVGTFVVPAGADLLRQYHDRNALYLNYNIITSAAGVVVNDGDADHAVTSFQYPALSPSDFQAILESQTVADLLSDTQPNLTWIWILAGAAILIFAIIMVFGGF